MADLITHLRLDGSDFNAGLQKASNSVDQFTRKTDSASNTVEELASNTSRSTKELLTQMQQMEGLGRSTSNYRRQLAQMQRDIADLTINYNQMGEAQNSAFGKEVANKILELKDQAAEYKDAILDVQSEITAMSSDTSHWDSMKAGISTVSAALEGFVSIGVLGEKQTDKLVAVIAKLKAIEAATNAVITVGNALQKNSAMMIGIRNIQLKAASIAQTQYAGATGAATVAQKAFNTVANANPYVLLASAVLGVVGALVAFVPASKDAETQLKNEQSALKDSKTEWDNYWDSVAEKNRNAGKSSAQIELDELNAKMAELESFQQNWARDNVDFLGTNPKYLNEYNEGLIRRAALEKQIAEEQKKNNGGGGGNTEPKALENSKEALNQQISIVQKLRDKQVVGTTEWEKQNEKLKEIQTQLAGVLLYEQAINGELLDTDIIIEESDDTINELIDDSNAYIDNLTDSIDGWIDIHKKINEAADAQKALKDAKFEGIQTALSTFTQISNTVEGFIDTLTDPDVSGWKKFLAVLELINSAMSTYKTITTMVTTVQEALTVARAKDTAAAAAQAAAEGTEAAAATGSAVSKGAESVASVPIVGPVLAVAAAAAIIAAIIAASKKAKFATGGIVGGNSYSGDYINAKVSSGELIMNQYQQKALWDFISGGSSVRSSTPNTVEFKIRGSELVGAINNYTKKQNHI